MVTHYSHHGPGRIVGLQFRMPGSILESTSGEFLGGAEVGGPNRPAPTKSFVSSIRFAHGCGTAHLPQVQWTDPSGIDNVRVGSRQRSKNHPFYLLVSA